MKTKILATLALAAMTAASALAERPVVYHDETSPSEEKTLESLESFRISFSVSVTVPDDIAPLNIYLEGEETPVTTASVKSYHQYMQWIIQCTCAEKLTKSGRYRVELPENYLYALAAPEDGSYADNVYFTVAAPDLQIQLLNPAEGEVNEEAFPNVTLGFPGYVSSKNSTLELIGPSGFLEDVTVNRSFMDGGMANQILIMTADAVTEDGTYTLEIPTGFFTDEEGHTNGRTEFTWDFVKAGGKEEPVENLTVNSLRIIKAGTMEAIDLIAAGKFDKFDQGDQLIIGTNLGESAGVMYMEVRKMLGDGEYETIRSRAYTKTKNEDGDFILNFMGTTKLTQGYRYEVLFNAIDSDNIAPYLRTDFGEYSIYLDGTCEPYKFSPVQLVSVDPEPESEIMDATAPYVLTFSAPVRLDEQRTAINTGFGTTRAFNSITSNDDRTVWTLVIDPGFVRTCTSQFEIIVAGTDDDGLVLEGNAGYEESSCWQISYNCHLGCAAVKIIPESGNVKSLFFFEASASPSIELSSALYKPYLINAAGETVAEVDMSSQKRYDSAGRDLDEIDDYDVSCVRTTFYLDKEISTPGHYTLVVPFAAFAIGEELNGESSRPMNVEYDVVESVSVKATEEVAFRVANTSDGVQVEGVEAGDILRIYTVDGRLAASVVSDGNPVNVSLPSGLYLLSTGNATLKHMVK